MTIFDTSMDARERVMNDSSKLDPCAPGIEIEQKTAFG